MAAVARDDPVLTFPLPAAGGSVTFSLARTGRYSIWVGGSTREQIGVVLDGRVVARADPQLNNDGQLVELARVEIAAGQHTVALRRDSAWWRPVEGALYYGSGPLVVSLADPSEQVEVLPSDEAHSLCGRPLDWVEALR